MMVMARMISARHQCSAGRPVASIRTISRLGTYRDDENELEREPAQTT